MTFFWLSIKNIFSYTIFESLTLPKSVLSFNLVVSAGVDLGFSRGGGEADFFDLL